MSEQAPPNPRSSDVSVRFLKSVSARIHQTVRPITMTDHKRVMTVKAVVAPLSRVFYFAGFSYLGPVR